MAKWTLVIGIGLILVTGGFCQSAGAAEASEAETQPAKIHDAGKHYPGNWTAWSISFKNKAAWKQVPYEKTDYKFKGDTVLENKFFYISFNANSQDDLHVKKGKGTLWRNVFYRCYYPKKIQVGGTKRYAGRTKHVKILKNTPNEVMVEHTGVSSSIMTTYRIFKDKPWVEVKPVKNAHMLGIHGKVRMALAVVEGGNDYVIDSLRDPSHSYVPPRGKMIICFFESVKNPFMWVLTTPSFKQAKTYFNCDSGPKGDTMWCDPGTRGGLKIPKKWSGCITSTYTRFGKQTEPVVEGALAYWHNWYRDHPDRPIKKGEVYTCKWEPPYPGKWRMTVRIAEKKYDQGFKYDGKTKFPAKFFSRNVIIGKKSTNGGKFTFKSPIDGWLDYSIMYMYDRTKETPKDILTPMDQYRWTIREKKVKRTVKLWDLGKKNYKRDRFRNRNLWKQVPHGKTDHKFENDVVMENDFFFIYYSTRYASTIRAKVNGEPRIWLNALYRRVWNGPYGYHGIKHLKIKTNSPDEVSLEHQGVKHPIPAVMRIFSDKRWIEVTPINRAEVTAQGIHGKIRMGLAPIEGGNDFVIDSLRYPDSYYFAPECNMLICFYESGKNPFMWVITFSAPFKEAKPCFNCNSGPRGDTMWWHGQEGCPKSSPGCVTSSWARYGKKGSVAVGALTHWHNWHRDEIGKPVKKGEVYTSKWKPPYPGKWRMTARVAEKKYDQGFKYDGKTKFPAKYFSRDVNIGKNSTKDGEFTFKSPINGVLDYVIMYMYDRTKDTPKDVQTPMDQYRWTIRQKKKNLKKE